MLKKVIGCSLAVCALAGCHRKTYPYLNAEEVHKAEIQADRNQADRTEWLEASNILAFRCRFPKKYLDGDQIEAAARLLRSTNDGVRHTAVGLFSDPNTDAEKSVAYKYLEPMTHDPDTYIRTSALLSLYHSKDPNIKELAQSNLGSGRAGDLEKQVSQKIADGKSPLANGT